MQNTQNTHTDTGRNGNTFTFSEENTMSKKEIVNQIKETVKPLMEKWEVNFREFVKEIEEYFYVGVYEENPEAKRNVELKFNLLKRKGYTQAMYDLFTRVRSEEDIKNRIHKEAETKLSKIDIAVTKKLKKVEVETVENLFFRTTGIDCYAEGAWKINGEKIFSFRTIYAGGFNIQCLHVRTLYSYK